MWAFILKLGKWALKIPVLFAHFPGPSLMLVVIAAIAVASVSSCVTHQLEAGARAELAIELANAKAAYADRRAEASEKREGTIKSATDQQRAIDRENQRIWFEQVQAFANAMKGAQLSMAAVGRAIEELHNDPAFDCRRLPLPVPYVDSMRLPAERPKAAAGQSGSH